MKKKSKDEKKIPAAERNKHRSVVDESCGLPTMKEKQQSGHTQPKRARHFDERTR